MARFTRVPFLVLLAAGCLPAQTYVVDGANGPGAHFTSISAAVAAVPDGATLRVRAGSYGGFTVQGKGLVILGEPGARVAGAFSVRGTTAAQAVVIRGLPLSSALDTVGVDQCQGPVLLEGVHSQEWCACNLLPTFSVWTSAQVQIRESIARGVFVLDSNVVIEGCDLNGSGASCAHGVCTRGFPTLTVIGGAVQIVDCTLTGGIGGGGFFYPLIPNEPAILCSGGSVRVLAPSVLNAGDRLGIPPVAAVAGSGHVRIDPLVTVRSAVNPPVVGATVRYEAMPAVRSGGAGPGGSMTGSALGPAGALAVLVVGWPGPEAFVPGIAEPFWMAVQGHHFAAIGVPQNGAPLTATVAVPNLPAFDGVRLAWQSVSLLATGLQASNPSAAVVR